jgi:amino-acid N-acetyltransferase
MLRKAKIHDAPEIQQLVNHYAEQGDMLPRPLHEIYEAIRDFVLWEEKGLVVGTCALHVAWEGLAEVRSLAVAKKFQGRGIGKALIRACLKEAENLGVKEVFALTYKPAFFQKLGFKEVEKSQFPQKIWTDCLKCAKFPNCDEVAVIYSLNKKASKKG